MENQFDVQTLAVGANEVAQRVRRSEAYPALLGAVAGGIAGALMAALIARRAAAPMRAPAEDERGAGRKSWLSTWTPKDVLQLLTIGIGLAKQAQAWRQRQRKGQ